MKFIFLRMSPASGINKCWSKREQWRQQYLGGLLKHYKELLGSLVLSTVVIFVHHLFMPKLPVIMALKPRRAMTKQAA